MNILAQIRAFVNNLPCSVIELCSLPVSLRGFGAWLGDWLLGGWRRAINKALFHITGSALREPCLDAYYCVLPGNPDLVAVCGWDRPAGPPKCVLPERLAGVTNNGS